jgi:multisubunit Na+/H+ antiporter MnhB subunit
MLAFMRYGLPALITAIGVLLCIMGHGHYTSVFANRDSLLSAMGVALIIIAVMIVMLNWLMRLAAESGDDRDREDAAREYFVRNGHWPSDS